MNNKIALSDYNFINIETKYTNIYRIVPIERLIETFSEKKNTIVHPSKWDDPFENLVLSSYFYDPDKNIKEFGMKNDIYAQCWTENEETDAMWRIYSHDKRSVKVKTTIEKLINSIINDNTFIINENPESVAVYVGDELAQRVESFKDPYLDRYLFIGKVDYQNINDLEETFKNITENIFSDGWRNLARSLLYKREEFIHENEIRIIYYSKRKSFIDDKIFNYTIDPSNLFDEIVFDPRLDKNSYETFKYVLTNKFNFDDNKIRQSDLYTPPDKSIFKINNIV